MVTLEDLLRSHEQLAHELSACLEAVALGDLAAAREQWQAFEASLCAHSQSEDELLLPAFAAAGLESNGCTVALLDKEHQKLRRLAAEARERMSAEHPSPLPAATRVAWISACHMLREVLEHHDVRERAALHPALIDALSPQENHELAAACWEREQELRAGFMQSGVAADPAT